MKKNETLYLKNTGTNINGTAIPTADFNTEEVDLRNNPGPVFIQLNRTSSSGTVNWWVEGSNDYDNPTNWVRICPVIYNGTGQPQRSQDYFPQENVAAPYVLPLSTTTRDAWFKDESCIWNFLRVAFDISGGPTGNLTATITKSRP